MPGLLLDVLNGKVAQRPPLWLMRQAGRYLPEYRALRAEKGGFLELVYDSAAAAEVTLQPVRRFGFDGAILFSDILIVPYALGQELWFRGGRRPAPGPAAGGWGVEWPARGARAVRGDLSHRGAGARSAGPAGHAAGLCRIALDHRHLYGRRARIEGPSRRPRAGLA